MITPLPCRSLTCERLHHPFFCVLCCRCIFSDAVTITITFHRPLSFWATLSNHHLACVFCGSVSDIAAQSADGTQHSAARDIFVLLQHRQTQRSQTPYNRESHAEERSATMMSLHPSCRREGAGSRADWKIRLEEGWPSTRTTKNKGGSYSGFWQQAALAVDHFAPGEHRLLSIRVRTF